MKKISDATIKAICAIDAEKLASKKIIQPARNGGYCCPMPDCSNGTGHDGTGIYPKNTNGYQHWWCPVCKENFNNLRIFSLYYGLDLSKEFAPLVEKICVDFDIDISYDEKDSPRTSRRRRKKNTTKPEPVNPAELAEIRADLNTNPDDLKWFVKIGCENEMWRGLPLDFLLKYGCRYVAKWIHPKIRVAKQTSIATPRLLIPCSDGESYLARLINPLDEYDEQARRYIHEKEHAGRKVLFNADALTADEIVFAVEGYIDCLSLLYAGFKAVGLGGANETAKLVDAVAQMQEKPRVLILLDSDKTGRDAAPKLYAELINIGVPCCVRYLFDDVTKTDANDILIRDGLDNLRGRLETIMDGALSELDAITKELEERQLHRHDAAALIDSLFAGDASDDDFADRLKIFCGDSVRWVKGENRWLTFERNEFGGAVWTGASAENSAVMPFAREMADVMKEFAETQSERELAEKFKSTKKKMQAITGLKGVKEIIITADDIKQHAELLNVRNGVIDLTSGELLPAAPELMMMKQAAVVYNPKCTDTTFADFLQSILPDTDTRVAVTSYLGYCLTGNVSAEKFLMIHGHGGNGKGVLLLTLRTLLGDYACELPVDTVLESKSKFADANGRATAEITPLVNRRLGIVDELPRNARFDVAKINRLTGRDYLPIRELHHEYKDVPPTHKLILTGNFRPQIDDTRDAALLRRLIVANFMQDFTKSPDVTLKDKLLADNALTGALNVFVTAAVEFYKRGKLLEPSAAMKRAREEFLGENDFIGDFLFELYEFGTGENFAVKRKDLLEHLRTECIDAARYRDADLTAMLAKVDGVTYTKDRTKTNIFKGIRRATKKDEQKQADAKDEFDGEILSSADWTPPPFCG